MLVVTVEAGPRAAAVSLRGSDSVARQVLVVAVEAGSLQAILTATAWEAHCPSIETG